MFPCTNLLTCLINTFDSLKRPKTVFFSILLNMSQQKNYLGSLVYNKTHLDKPIEALHIDYHRRRTMSPLRDFFPLLWIINDSVPKFTAHMNNEANMTRVMNDNLPKGVWWCLQKLIFSLYPTKVCLIKTYGTYIWKVNRFEKERKIEVLQRKLIWKLLICQTRSVDLASKDVM